MHNRKIHARQVGRRYFRGEGDMIPTDMKIEVLAVVRFDEESVGATLRAQQIAFFHFRLPLFNSPGYGESTFRAVGGRLPQKDSIR